MAAAQPSVQKRPHLGRLFLILGLLAAIGGIGANVVQMQLKMLWTPWYMPILATAGLVMIVMALVQSRTITRWVSGVLVGLLAALEWFMLMVMAAVPAYVGVVKVGVPFPDFSTTLASGSSFTRQDLEGEQNTVLLFYRGHW